MTINHLNLTVADVVATRRFLERYFGLRPMDDSRENPGFDLLWDDSGMVLTLIIVVCETVDGARSESREAGL